MEKHKLFKELYNIREYSYLDQTGNNVKLFSWSGEFFLTDYNHEIYMHFKF